MILTDLLFPEYYWKIKTYNTLSLLPSIVASAEGRTLIYFCMILTDLLFPEYYWKIKTNNTLSLLSSIVASEKD